MKAVNKSNIHKMKPIYQKKGTELVRKCKIREGSDIYKDKDKNKDNKTRIINPSN